MQKQQDMGKARWLSKPTLVGGLSVSIPRTTGLQKRGSRANTLNLHPPQISQLKSPWGRRKPHHTTVRGVVVLGAYKTRPQKFCGKGGNVVNRPYHLRSPHPKRKQGWLEVATTFWLTHVQGQDCLCNAHTNNSPSR